MRPKTLRHMEVVKLSGSLSPLTTTQVSWAFRETHEHFAFRLKSGVTTCMDCGHEWKETAKNGTMCRCPKCGARLQIKDTKERVVKQKSYFNVITTKADYQVIRSFQLISEMRKGYQAKYSAIAICEYWIDERGKTAIMGLCRAMNSYFYDVFNYCSPFEIRNDNEAFQRIAGEWVYPRIRVTDTIKRNGFDGSTHCIHPVELFKQLLTNPKTETLMKANEIELLRHCTYHPAEVDRYWKSIKIAMRHGYKFEDVTMWFDYIKMLERMGKDLNSPTLIMPQDLKAAHDRYVEKVNRKREEERREADLQKAIKEEATFQELKSKFFGFEMTDGEINLHSIDSINQYYEIGQKMSICVFSSRYYLKEKSLVLTAVKDNKIVGVVEISLDDYSILQCRAFANGTCEYTDRIKAIIEANTAKIAERNAA
ncbi:MAG: PcfJ domain-containing protein [Muribaculum sp.]|nr:PcfJ domain-containing protein [Muribaculum sp.]